MIFDLSRMRKTFHCLLMAGVSGKRSFVRPSEFPLLPVFPLLSPSWPADREWCLLDTAALASFENLVMAFILSAIPQYLVFTSWSVFITWGTALNFPHSFLMKSLGCRSLVPSLSYRSPAVFIDRLLTQTASVQVAHCYWVSASLYQILTFKSRWNRLLNGYFGWCLNCLFFPPMTKIIHAYFKTLIRKYRNHKKENKL